MCLDVIKRNNNFNLDRRAQKEEDPSAKLIDRKEINPNKIQSKYENNQKSKSGETENRKKVRVKCEKVEGQRPNIVPGRN